MTYIYVVALEFIVTFTIVVLLIRFYNHKA